MLRYLARGLSWADPIAVAAACGEVEALLLMESLCEQLVHRRELYGVSYLTIGTDLADAFGPDVERLVGK